jgi:hypothetical protein
MGGAGSTYGEKGWSTQDFGREELLERDNLVDPVGDGRIILRYISKDWDWEAWTGLT